MVEEPGRRIVRAESDPASPRLPWNDLASFAEAALDLAAADLPACAEEPGTVIFDRGLLDAAVAYRHATGRAPPVDPGGCYDRDVLIAPPWPELFEGDAERRHGIDAAVAEYDRLTAALPEHGYRAVMLPRVPVDERVRFVLRHLAAG